MERDPTRNGLRLPPVAPLAIVDSRKPDVVPGVPTVDIGDPYEVAYLRGGDIEVLRLYLFELVQRGYIEVIETKKLLSSEHRFAISPNAPSLDALTGTQRTILGWFATPLTARETLMLSTREPLRSICEGYREQLRADGQLRSAYGRWLQVAVFIAGGVVLLALGGVGWGILGFAIAVAANLAAGKFLSRLTPWGQERLKSLEARCSDLRDRPRTSGSAVADPAAVMAVAVFGTVVLIDTAYDAFADAVGPSASWSDEADGDGDGGCGGCGGCD
jgi:uncharacterized protein (TIGR04222 family)